MSLSPHHQNQLHLIEAGLLRSDPQLAARLSVFGRLFAGQAMPAWEQVSGRHDRIGQAAALTAEAISVVAAGHRPAAQGGPGPGAGEHRHRHRPRPPGGPAGPAATRDRPPATRDVTR